MSEKAKMCAVIDDPLNALASRERVSAKDMEFGGEHPRFTDPMVVLVSDTTDVTYARRVLRDLNTFGRAVVLEVETVDRRMDVARDALTRFVAETQEVVSPTPKNRRERRASAAKARKGGGR